MDICSASAALSGPRWHGQGNGGRHAPGGTRRPPPCRNLSSPVRTGSGSRGAGGPEVEVVGGVGGAQGRGAGGGLWAACGRSVVTGLPLSRPGAGVVCWTVRDSSERNAARTGRPPLGPWPPPARASTSRTPRSTYGTSSSWTVPRGVSRGSVGGPSQSGQRSGSGQGRPQGPQVPQTGSASSRLAGEGR